MMPESGEELKLVGGMGESGEGVQQSFVKWTKYLDEKR